MGTGPEFGCNVPSKVTGNRLSVNDLHLPCSNIGCAVCPVTETGSDGVVKSMKASGMEFVAHAV